MFQFQAATNRIDLSLGLLERNAFAQAADNTKVMCSPRVVMRIDCPREPNVRIGGKFSLWRQDADDVETAIGKTQDCSFQIRSAFEHSFPIAKADDGDLICLR